MIQAIGLTSTPREELPPAVDDVSFEARAGRVTALLGTEGAGKTTTLRLMLELQQGRGVTYFRGRPLHRIAHPSREVGVLLGDVPGHPARTVRGHLRMLCAAAGVPVQRADDVLEVVGLVSLRAQRLGTLSRGMDRRLGLGCALLADPHTLVLDGPAEGLSAREGAWLHGILRAHAYQGGTVLFTTGDPKEAARTADRVVTLEAGRLVADQEAADFARTRLRPRVAVLSPHAARLGALLTKEARANRRSIEVVTEGGNRLSVYGSNCADVGEAAYRHSILMHQLADEVGDAGPAGSSGHWGPPEPWTPPIATPGMQGTAENETGRGETVRGETAQAETARGEIAQAEAEPPAETVPLVSVGGPRPSTVPPAPPSPRGDATSCLPPPITVQPGRSPLRPLRYELRRLTGVGTGYFTLAAVLATSALICVLLARAGHTPQPRLLAAWPQELPLPPTALGAGLLGALAFGDEFRHPALAVDRGTVPRRLGLLVAKLLVAAATAVLSGVLTVGADAVVLHLVYGEELTRVPADWLSLSVSWTALLTGCAWAGVLAAGTFRSTTAGLAAVLGVPIVVVPLVQKAVEGPAVRSAAGLSGRLRDLALMQWPFGAERYVEGGMRMIIQPVGGALTLSLAALLCAYVLTAMRSGAR
ncbi:ATP-binding cassette domain-containing protein [Streptomyces sp. G5(2025)]|uniref:ATP-binding cassette domain-containing protein n=1 Tax=Streptomyces sp. G5(2025) TaxID=3406628 RepID=UPI003C29AD8F